MNKRGITFLVLSVFLVLSMLVACERVFQPVLPTSQQVEGSEKIEYPVADTVTEKSETSAGVQAASTAVVTAQHSKDHGSAEDYVWDSAASTGIALDGNSITIDGDGATAAGSKVTITSAGTYSISGSLAEGQIIVDTQDEETVRLVLNGANISNSTGAPIYVMNAEKTVIILADGTENYVADGELYVFEQAEEDEPNAAIFSKDDLTIYGNGSLAVYGNYNDGIASKDGLIIAGGTIAVTAVDDGIRGKDYLVIENGHVTVTAQGDGLKSDEEEDATKGYVSIEGGVINVTSGGDAIQAATDVTINGGDISLSSGGGSNGFLDADTSAKGIKATVSLIISGGTITIDSADDALHSNGSLVINAGTFTISSGDDAMHADSTLEVNGGQISVMDSFEGMEGAVITINDGDIRIVSSDDGLNVVGGNDGSGMNRRPGPGRGPGQDAFTYSGSYYLYINGGYVVIDAAGDGMDINGAIEMTDGVVIVNGPTENMNGALDYDAYFKITGGFLVAAGSAGMAQAPGESSTQYSLLLNYNSVQRAGTLVHIRTSEGEEILTFSPTKEYQSIAFSSPELTSGSTYEVYSGGSYTGVAEDGLYRDGTYTAGSQYTSFTVSSTVTMIGGGRMR